MELLDPTPALGVSPVVSPSSVHGGAAASTVASGAVALSALDIGAFATIHSILPADGEVDRHLVMRLIEIGFVPGERVRVIAVGHPGREPIAVRLSATDSGRRTMSGATFAMRRHEADFIRVVPDRVAADRT